MLGMYACIVFKFYVIHISYILYVYPTHTERKFSFEFKFRCFADGKFAKFNLCLLLNFFKNLSMVVAYINEIPLTKLKFNFMKLTKSEPGR